MFFQKISFKFNFQNFLLILLALFLGIFIGLGIIFFINKKPTYYAVFLNNGLIYFGKLSFGSKLKLDDAVFFQVDSNNNVSLQYFKDAFWQPKGPIYLNPNAVLFIAPLSDKSQLIDFIEKKVNNNNSLSNPSLKNLNQDNILLQQNNTSSQNFNQNNLDKN